MPRTTGLNPNLAAFLDMLAWSEIGPELLSVSDNGYNVLVGSTPRSPLLFPSYATHPHILDKELDSTAAGRYQIILPTWTVLQKRLDLVDFGPESQDTACIELIHGRSALDAVLAGQFDQALVLCAPEWASLPASTAGQHLQKFSVLEAAYRASGGVIV